MSGQDILDQAAGTTPFVQNYLHIDWDGTETQNDKATDAVHSVTGNPVTDGIGDGADRPLGSERGVRGPDHPDRARRPRRSPTTTVRPMHSPSRRWVQGHVPGVPVRGIRHGR